MSDSISKKIFRNSAYSYVGFIILVAVQFFSTPYIVRILGKDAYGIYALISVFIGYVSLLELGIGASIIKYVSEYHVEKRYDKINKLVNTAFILFLSLGFIGALIILIFREKLATSLFKVPPYLAGDTIFAFTIAGIAFFFTFVFGIYISVLVGLQRMDLTNKISTVLGILNFGGIVALLWLGYGLKEVVILTSINGIIGVLISAYTSKRIIPELSLLPRFLDRSYVKSILHFSLYVFASKVAVLVYQNFGKFIVGIFLPIKYVTIYAVGTLISSFIYRLSGLIVAPVMPASSELLAKKDKEAIKELFIKGTKYVTIINIPSIVFLAVLAEDIIKLWMGEGFEESVIIFQILLLGVFFNTLIHVGGNILPGIGKPNVTMYYAILTVVTNIILSLILIIKVGFIGAALGDTIAQIFIAPVMIFHLCKSFGLSIFKLFQEALIKPILAVSLPALFIYYIKLHFIISLLNIILIGITFIIIYCLIILFFILDKKDMELLFKLLPRMEYYFKRLAIIK